MSKTDVDTEKLKEAGHEMTSLALEYREIVNALYDKINSYASTGIWVGIAAENYKASVNTEKSEYDAFGTIISNYGKALINSAENYEEFIRKSDYHE